MGRERTPFKRPEGKRSARLIVIAAEGRETEKIYFESLAQLFDNSSVHVEVLPRFDNNSSPDVVFNQLLDFNGKYEIDDDDELWIVIDKDRWNIKTIKDIARECNNKHCYHLALSNPAFELWLLLHKEDVALLSEDIKEKILKNKREKKGQDPFMKRYLRSLLGSYSESQFEASSLIVDIDLALERAALLDVAPEDRWPQGLGTRVYLLAKSIMRQ